MPISPLFPSFSLFVHVHVICRSLVEAYNPLLLLFVDTLVRYDEVRVVVPPALLRAQVRKKTRAIDQERDRADTHVEEMLADCGTIACRPGFIDGKNLLV